MKFKFEVIADSSGKFCGNAQEFETQVEAESAARNLESRWMLVREWRVLEFDGMGMWTVLAKLPR